LVSFLDQVKDTVAGIEVIPLVSTQGFGEFVFQLMTERFDLFDQIDETSEGVSLIIHLISLLPLL
jgi:hypothetical protein